MAVAKAGKTSNKGGKGQQKFDDTNRGVLFQNDKGDNEARPDYTGNLALKPDDYEVGPDGLIRVRLAAWIKPNEKVGDFLSISASPSQE